MKYCCTSHNVGWLVTGWRAPNSYSEIDGLIDGWALVKRFNYSRTLINELFLILKNKGSTGLSSVRKSAHHRTSAKWLKVVLFEDCSSIQQVSVWTCFGLNVHLLDIFFSIHLSGGCWLELYILLMFRYFEGLLEGTWGPVNMISIVQEFICEDSFIVQCS